MTDFNAKVLWLAAFAQNTVTVDPAMLDIVNIVANNKQIGSIYELLVADVREKVWLHDSNMAFPVNHNT
jgi:hypothetical protein